MNQIELTDEQAKTLREMGIDISEPVTIVPPKKKWEPEGGRFYIVPSLDVAAAESEESTLIVGMESPTRELAQAKANHLRKTARLISYVQEYAPDYVVPDDGIVLSVCCVGDGVWDVARFISRAPTTVYMPERVARDLVAKLNSGEVVL